MLTSEERVGYHKRVADALEIEYGLEEADKYRAKHGILVDEEGNPASVPTPPGKKKENYRIRVAEYASIAATAGIIAAFIYLLGFSFGTPSPARQLIFIITWLVVFSVTLLALGALAK